MGSEQEPGPTPPLDSPAAPEAGAEADATATPPTAAPPAPSVAEPAPEPEPEPEPPRELDFAFFAKLALLSFVIAYSIAFVVGNDKRISVDFIFVTERVSLVWAVLLLLLVGFGGGLLVSHLYRHRRRKQSRKP